MRLSYILKISVGVIAIAAVFGLYYVGGKADAETTLITTTTTFVTRTPYPTWYYQQITIALIALFASIVVGALLLIGLASDIENSIKRKSSEKEKVG